MGAILLAAILATGGDLEAQATAAWESGEPLVVYICADWCPACVRMQQDCISKLRGCRVAILDYDADREQARKYMQGNSIPQTIIYRREGDRWTQRNRWSGRKATREINEAVEKARQEP